MIGTALPQDRFLQRLFAVVALLSLLVIVVVVWVLVDSRQYHQERAETLSKNMALMLESHIGDTFDKIDLVLPLVSEEFEQQKLNASSGHTELSAYIGRIHSRMPGVDSIRIANANGVIIVTSGKIPETEINIADRPHFKFHRNRADVGLHISAPVISRIGGNWIIIMSRRMDNPDGTFGGMVYATIDMDYFFWLFSMIDIGPKGSITLRNLDQDILVRYPPLLSDEPIVNRKTSASELQQFMQSGGQAETVHVTSTTDAISRVVSIRRIGNHPLYVAVGLARVDYLGKWWQAVYGSVSALAMFLLATSLLVWRLIHYWHDRRRLMVKLERSRSMFRELAEMSSDWFWQQDEHFHFVETHDGVSEKYGLTPENFYGKARWEIAIDKTEEEWQAHKAMLEAHESFESFEYCFLDGNGSRRCISVSGGPIYDDDGRFIGYRGTGRDVTQRREYEDSIQKMAQHDALTGLPNRSLFYDRIEQAVSLAKREAREFALLYFDLDKFKPVNDIYGHDVGDQILKSVAVRGRELLRESDTFARIGGDEFSILLPSIESCRDAIEVAERVIASLTSPFVVEGVADKLFIGVSIGIALYPQDGQTGDDLVKSADSAMYKSKKKGNCYAFSDAGVHSVVMPEEDGQP